MEKVKPTFKEGQRVTCLPKSHVAFTVKDGPSNKPRFFYNGMDDYCGKKATVETVMEMPHNDGLGYKIIVRWDDGGRRYQMREGEFSEYYDDSSKYYDSSRFHMSEISIPNVSSDKLLLLL